MSTEKNRLWRYLRW